LDTRSRSLPGGEREQPSFSAAWRERRSDEMRVVSRLAARAAFAAAAACLTAAVPVARAGWIVEEIDADFPEAVQTFYFQGGRARVEGLLGSAVFLVDIHSREVYLVDGAAGRYAGGPIADVAAVFRKERGGRKADPGSEGKPPRGPVVIDGQPAVLMLRVEKSDGGESIAGFATEHYRVIFDEEVIEEIWVAPALDVAPDGGVTPFAFLFEEMTGGREVSAEFPPGYEEQASYRQLLRVGYPVRRIRYYVGEKIVTEVRRVTEKDLPDEIFTLPPGLEKTDYHSLFFGRD
jgi:hypothetical protein